MPRRKGLRSGRARRPASPQHANRDDVQQRTPPSRPLRRETRKLPQRENPLAEDPPQRIYLSGSVIPDSQEDPPGQRYPSGRIIPDSQEDPADFDHSDVDFDDEFQYLPDYSSTRVETGHISPEPIDTEEDSVEYQNSLAVEFPDSQPESEESFETVATEIIPGGVKLTPKPNHLHKEGLDCNGRLACEHPDIDSEMEEEPTQATQPRFDARRKGSSSMVSLQDEADVVCILHPTSKAAIRATEMVAEYCPQHILQNTGLSHNLDYDVVEKDQTTRPDDLSADDQRAFIDGDEQDLAEADGPGSHSKDIAMRFSSKVHQVWFGWTFGRNMAKCDIPIVDKDETLKVSNMHFRIYLNQSGVLMLEDTSTNGTWVDDIHLQSKGGHPGQKPRRTIQAGSIIQILQSPPDPIVKFVVAIPPRNRGEAKYNQKLGEYMNLVRQSEYQNSLRAQAAANGDVMPPPAILPFGHALRNTAEIPSTVIAAHTPYNHGMTWNGGDTYNVVGHVGKGAFANVYKLSTKQDGELFAAKELEKRRFMKDGILDRKAHNEIDVMKQINHPNIIDYVGSVEMPKHLYIIMEYVPYGDLRQYIDGPSVMPEFKCRYVAHQIMSALRYLHRLKITHRDIKPDNILIASDDPFIVKLTDFGLSKITKEDTFLKTFCGTLLYCAPEVYPDYDQVKAGLPRNNKRRHRDERKLPYHQSADTWAFAAVLFHLMCGQEPFTGTAEDRGAVMLRNIMTDEADFGRLIRVGISPEGVDFVEKMLVREPSERATDEQCLRHPWIADLSSSGDTDLEMEVDTDNLPMIEEEGEELDASQLNLNDDPEEAGFDDSDYDGASGIDELEQLRQSKRARTNSPRATGYRQEAPSSSRDSFDTIPMMLCRTPDPALNRAPPRLFGEIGTSALRSSGVLGEDAHAALDMPAEGSHDDDVSVSDASAIDVSTTSRVTSDDIAQHPLQYPQTLPGPAPSLLGTEALVDQLNMASPESGPSGPSIDGKSGTPHTPRSRELSPSASAIAGLKRCSQEAQADPDSIAFKRAKPRSPKSPPKPKANASNLHTSHHATQTLDGTHAGQDRPQNEASLPKSQADTTAGAQETTEYKGQASGKTSRGKDKAITTSSSVAPYQDAPATRSHPQQNSHSSDSTNSTSTSTIAPAPTAPSFPLPAPILGRLNTVSGSVIETTHFNLTTRITYYGRIEEKPHPSSTTPFTSYIYPHNMDSRVPKNALDIMFWRPGIEADERKGKDWIEKDDFWAILLTRTSGQVWVNGVKLVKGKGCALFGKLYTGDVITVFGPSASANKEGGSAAPKEGGSGTAEKKSKSTEYLRFECEFFAGKSKPRRPASTPPFVVETETQKYQEMQARRSREASMRASTSAEASPAAEV